MIRDILNAVTQAMLVSQPPATSAITPASANTGTGAVVFAATSAVYGAFDGRLEVLSGGSPGTATAQLSLDGGNNYDAPFTLPAVDPYKVPLPPMTSFVLSPGPSGLELSFSGSFNVGDVFSFSALPTVTVLVGKEELSSQDTLFPRVVHFPAEDEFSGTEDYAQGQDQRTRARSLVTDVAHFETHCWGLDYDRAEQLRDLVINGIHFAVQATKLLLRGHWEHDEKIAKAGRLYVLTWSVKKPVLVLRRDTIPVPPPHTASISTLVQTP